MTVWVKEVATNAMRWPQPRARPRIICKLSRIPPICAWYSYNELVEALLLLLKSLSASV